MSNLKQSIEAFAASPHKNISILLKQTTVQEIESTLDTIAHDAGWTDKEVKEKDGTALISYRTQIAAFKLSNLSGVQIIESTLLSKDGDTQLDIESRLSPSLTYGATSGQAVAFFDLFSKNKENLQILNENLKKMYQERFVQIKELHEADPHQRHDNQSANTLGTALAKFIYLLVALVLLGLTVYFFGFIVWVFFQNLNNYL